MRQKKLYNQSLLNLENSLKNKFHPVEPSQQFVRQLRTQLEESPILLHRKRTAATLLTLAGGLLVGLAIFLIGRRFLHQSGEA